MRPTNISLRELSLLPPLSPVHLQDAEQRVEEEHVDDERTGIGEEVADRRDRVEAVPAVLHEHVQDEVQCDEDAGVFRPVLEPLVDQVEAVGEVRREDAEHQRGRPEDSRQDRSE